MKSIDIQSLARDNVKKLTPYSSARDDFQGSASVFLDANENPFPSPFNRYPDPHQRDLRRAIAQLCAVDTKSVFLGNGSDEVIDLLLRAFCEPGRDEVIIPQPTYGMYSVSAEINNVSVNSILLTDRFDLDVHAVLNAITPRTKMIFLCSPNNPTGNLLGKGNIEKILSGFEGIVVIDEAYIHFSDFGGWLPRLAEFQNLVVLQTFSKAWGMAGLRLGIGFAAPTVIHLLEKIKPPYNINAFTQSTALDAILNAKDQRDRHVNAIRSERDRLMIELPEMPRVSHVFPTDANFLLVQVVEPARLYDQLVAKKIIVRDRSGVILCNDCLRITVGTKEENDQLIKTLQGL